MISISRRIRREFNTADDADRWVRSYQSGIARADAAIAVATPRLVEIVEPYILSRQAQRDAWTVACAERYRRVIASAARSLPERIDEIMPSHLEAWAVARKRSVCQATARLEMGMILSVLRWADGRPEYAPSGETLPALRAKLLDRPEASTPYILELPELIRFLGEVEAARPHIALPLWCMALTGARPAAVVSLRWRDYRRPSTDAPGSISLPTLKGGDPVRRPIPARSPLDGVFRRAMELWGDTWGKECRRKGHAVFCAPRSKRQDRGYSPREFSHQASLIGTRLGHDRFTAYTVRHSVMHALKAGGIDPVAVRHYAAHTTEATQRIYDHTTAIHAAPALDYIASAIGADMPRVTDLGDSAQSEEMAS